MRTSCPLSCSGGWGNSWAVNWIPHGFRGMPWGHLGAADNLGSQGIPCGLGILGSLGPSPRIPGGPRCGTFKTQRNFYGRYGLLAVWQSWGDFITWVEEFPRSPTFHHPPFIHVREMYVSHPDAHALCPTFPNNAPTPRSPPHPKKSINTLTDSSAVYIYTAGVFCFKFHPLS